MASVTAPVATSEDLNLSRIASCAVVIPAFNEEATIRTVVQGVRSHLPNVEVVVVDDGSGDFTAIGAQAAGARLIRHAANLGYGAAVQTGLRYARNAGYDTVTILDADGQHDPADLPRLLAPLTRGEADLAVGSRYLGGRDAERWFSMRRIGTAVMSQLVFLLTGTRIRDVTSGFQAMSARTLALLAAEYPVDFPDADIILLLLIRRFRIQEIPVVIGRRTAGVSMHGLGSAFIYPFKMLLSMIAILLRARMERRGGA